MKRALALAIFAGHSMAVTGCGDDAASSKPTPSTPRADGGSPVGGAGGAASGGLGTGGADTGTGGVGGAAPDAGTGGTSDGPQPGPPTAEITLDRTCPSPKPLGSGAFGCWISDRFGRPAYLYTAAPGEGAAFTRREGPAGADDHWHQLGNFRVTASAHADGRVRLFDGTRGGKWVSPYSEHRITTWDGATLPTAGRRLVFGTGYVQVSDAAGDVRSERSVFAPFGDVPALVVEHRLQNLGAAPTEVEVVETWDAAMEQLTVALTYGSTPQLADGARDRLMGSFVQAAERDADGRAVRVHTLTGPEVMRPDPAAPAEFDFYPGTLALASLDGPVSASAVVEAPCEAGCTPRTLATKGGATTRFGPPPNGLAAWEGQMIGPQAATRRDLAPTLARRVSLPPGTEVTLRFAVAYADTPAMDAALEALRAAPPTLAETVAAWAEIGPEVRFPAGDDTAQALAREFAWHGPYLLGAANYDAFYGVHAIDQGSAYGYLQGLRGAARDNLINAVAALPLAPWLAAEQIRYILGATHPDGTRISYGTSGFGELQNAVVHRKPSDLDLWLLWAVVEYVQGTRDFAFLDTPVELHRDGAAPGPSLTVAARLGTSLDWLEGEIGYGEHGLLRVGSGDWSDGISFLAPDRVAFEANGESVFNSAFAAYVFPRIAGLLDGRDDALAARYRTAGEALRMAVASQFQGRWFTRAWDGGSPPAPIAADDGTDEARLSLEHHVWVLVGDVPTAEQRTSVIAALADRLGGRSPLGTALMYPPIDNMFLHPGWDVNGGVWAAMNGLLVWGLSRTDPEAAWAELVANSMVRHAETHPDLWYGIWSGPDAYNAAYTDRPGETFYHVATPMTDYPVQNSNRHALPLLDAVKLAGFESTPAGVVLDPRMAPGPFSLRTPLFGIDDRATDPALISGHIDFRAAGEVRVRVPEAWTQAGVSLRVNGADAPATVDGGFAVFSVPAGRATFEVRETQP
jgi:hypothetical protein